jgi:hypothetical protein
MLNTSVFSAKALDIALSTGEISLDKLHLLLGCSRGQAIGAAFDLQEHGLAEDIESTKNLKGEYFLIPIDKRCEAARLYRAKLEQRSRDMGLCDVFSEDIAVVAGNFHGSAICNGSKAHQTLTDAPLAGACSALLDRYRETAATITPPNIQALQRRRISTSPS